MIRSFFETEIGDSREIKLNAKESHYLLNVRRVTVGERFELRDTSRKGFECRVSGIENNAVKAIIEREIPNYSTRWPVSLIVAVPKRSLFDDFVRQANEIGVDRIQPVVTERSVVNPGRNKMERWRRIARESVRQCGRAEPVIIEDTEELEKVFDKFDRDGLSLILHPTSRRRNIYEILERGVSPSITMAIGPEGGFTERELSLASEAGFIPVMVGESVLRTETAAIVAAVLGIAAFEVR